MHGGVAFRMWLRNRRGGPDAAPHTKGNVKPLSIWRLIMTISRIFSAVCVLLALAFGSLATSACTSATDSSASGSSGNSSSGGY
jgi:hypothetical protein